MEPHVFYSARHHHEEAHRDHEEPVHRVGVMIETALERLEVALLGLATDGVYKMYLIQSLGQVHSS